MTLKGDGWLWKIILHAYLSQKIIQITAVEKLFICMSQEKKFLVHETGLKNIHAYTKSPIPLQK